MLSELRNGRPLLLLAAAALFACTQNTGEDEGREPVLTAAALGEQVVKAPADYLAEAEYRDADAERGYQLGLQCRACHSFEAGGAHLLGPNLFDFFGRQAGTAEGFPFSKAMRDSDFVWTPRALDAWLTSPTEFLPGNTMSYAGLRDESDRRALIASLLRETAP